MEFELERRPVTALKGVGPTLQKKLARLNIHTIQDVLFHLPLRYEDRTRLTPIGALRPGEVVSIEGKVELTELRYGKRTALLCYISDGTGGLLLRFFHFSAQQKQLLAAGTALRCYGEVRGTYGQMEMVHPEYRVLHGPVPVEAALTPVYPATEGVAQRTLRGLSQQVLALLNKEGKGNGPREWLPPPLLAQLQLPSLNDALLYVHRPPADAPLLQLQQGQHPAQRRLVFEELLAHHLSLRRVRTRIQRLAAPKIDSPGTLFQKLTDLLPFALTRAQWRVIEEIRRDMNAGAPMLRLVQGDVGSGKTLVAAAGALAVVEAGFQAAIMAPTELLAEQHYRNFRNWLEPLGLRVAWLSGKLPAAERRAALAQMVNGEAHIVIGTHALFQAEVEFAKLALIVIDEQHRFGVGQRLALRQKGRTAQHYPHQLIMTATPIPRTLAMTLYADLDVSVIDELPPGRIPVTTAVIPEIRRDEIIERVRQACGKGHQAYWVCTLIDESEVLECEAAENTAANLTEALPELNVGLIHGRLKPAERELIMSRFKAGELQLLVATTVIEVGVDVPNANLMIIENAERLGLSQLHQLRGRVGRGSAQSSCVLMYHGNLSENGRARLATMRETNDGFVIAQRDMELRGPGEVLGVRQSGLVQLKVADLLRDQALFPEVERAARQINDQWPDHIEPLIARWVKQAEQYSEV